MKADFISRKERVKFNDAIYERELERNQDKLGCAINNLEAAKFNRNSGKDSAYREQVKYAIELLQKEIH